MHKYIDIFRVFFVELKMGLKVSKVDETSEGAVSNAGTLNAKAGNTDLKLKKDQTTTVEGGKLLHLWQFQRVQTLWYQAGM